MSEQLRMDKALVEEMVDYCLAGRPNEACGILAGEGDRIVRVFPMSNASASPVRYSLEPREQLEIYRRLDDEGWDLGGVFHSHTHTDAYPSPTDVREAREDVPYVIVSLAEDPPAIRAFRILKDNWMDEDGEVVELAVSVEPG